MNHVSSNVDWTNWHTSPHKKSRIVMLNVIENYKLELLWQRVGRKNHIVRCWPASTLQLKTFKWIRIRVLRPLRPNPDHGPGASFTTTT